MKPLHATEELLARFGNHYVPVKVDIWAAEKPRMTAICFHQYFGTSTEFNLLGQSFAAEGITLVAPNLPGRLPGAFLSGSLRYDLPTFLTLLLQICERYQTTKNCLIGRGFGGLLCLAAVRAKLLRPDALILHEVPLRGSWLESRLEETTRALCGLSSDDPDKLVSRIVAVIQENGFGRHSLHWAKALIRQRGESFGTILDPALAAASWPDFNFTEYLEGSATPTAIFCNSAGGLASDYVDARIPGNPRMRLFTYSASFQPGFAVTSSTIIKSFLNPILDK